MMINREELHSDGPREEPLGREMPAAKVLIITAVHRPDDVRVFHRQAVALAEAGLQVTLCAPGRGAAEYREGVRVLPVPPVRRRWMRPLLWWRLLLRVLRSDAEVVHFHDPELLLLVPLLRLLRGHRIRLVYDVHEYFIASLVDKHWYPRVLSPAVVFVARVMERWLSSAVDAVVLVVEGQRELYQHFDGAIAVVRNLPRVEVFEDPEPVAEMAGEGLCLLYSGLILPKRGVDDLLAAMVRLREDGHHDIRLFLLGAETSAPYMRNLECFLRDHSLEEQVRWLGWVPHDRLKHYFAAAQVGIAPGVRTAQYDRDALSTKLFEYMLCGLPVVSVDLPYQECFVRAAGCGVVVPVGEIEAMAEAILWMREHREEAVLMGRRGRELVLDRYTWTTEKQRLIELYEDLLRR